MVAEVQERVETVNMSPEDVSVKTSEIYETILRQSEYFDAGNFTVIHEDDLKNLFDLYDRLFFAGDCRALLQDIPLSFRLSKRMTQAAGKMVRSKSRNDAGIGCQLKYEIVISATLLFNAFRGENRPIVLCGIQARDRLEVLQRTLEHEITHLIEMLIRGDSSCSEKRFQSIASRFFGHTEHTHQLVTSRERAFTKFGIKPGDCVSFHLKGQCFVGIVSRITKRATVLVEDERGMGYSDGKRYTRFYVPVRMLERVSG